MEEGNSSANQTEDVMKEFLVYNADLRLKSRQIVRKPRRQRKLPVKKQTLYYFGTIIVSLILIYIFLLWFAGYDAERYASVFSATIQGVSTIFALVAAGTLLLVERVGVRSPRSLSFLPTLWVTGLFSVFILVIALDIVVMLVLPIDSSWSWLIKFILVLNVASISLSAVYVRSLLAWFDQTPYSEFLRIRPRK